MALILTETLEDGRVMTYHRVAEFVFTSAQPIVRFTLESFPTADDRADPTVQPYSRDWDFPFLGSGDPRAEAYRALLARSEWAAAVAGDDNAPTPEPGEFEARPAGQAQWDAAKGDWAGEDVDSVADEKWRQMTDRFDLDRTEDIFSGGLHFFATAQWQQRLTLACAAALRAADPDAFTRTWWGEDWAGPLTLTGTQLLQLQADMAQREQEASEHLALKKQEILDAMEITPEAAAITAIKAIQWEFDAPFWGMP